MADRRRILIADSDTRRRRVTATLLRLGGHSVIEVERMADIPDAARDGIDAIVTEAILVDGDGVAYASSLRSDPATAALPIVVATADRTAEPRVREILGPAAFLLLPARPSVLLARVSAGRAA